MVEESSEVQTGTDTSELQLNQAEKLLLHLLRACHTNAMIGVEIISENEDSVGYRVHYYNDSVFIAAIREACNGRLKDEHAFLSLPLESNHIFYIRSQLLIDLNKVKDAFGGKLSIRINTRELENTPTASSSV